MNQSRYQYAFLLSSLIFLVLYFIFLSFSANKKVLKPTPSQVINIAIITPPTPIKKIIKKKVIKKKIIKKKIIKKKIMKKKIMKKKIIKKKVIKKKVIKKKIIKKKVIKKKVIKKKIIKKKVMIKKVVQKTVKKVLPTPIPIYKAPKVVSKPRIKPISKPVTQVKNNKHKKAFLQKVRSRIIANKKYPKLAKRRHMEGSVKVRFNITKTGEVRNIRFISGKSIFQKSITKTLERSFPMGIPANVQGELPILDVSLVLHFNLR